MVKKLVAKVISVHAGSNDDLSKEEQQTIQVELDGIVGDRHRSHVRETWPGDKQPEGTKRRNERQWSAVSVEEYNPPCHDMGKQLADKYTTRSGGELASTAFPKAAKLTRGLVGVVEVAGTISAGDEVTVELYETPSWLVRAPD